MTKLDIALAALREIADLANKTQSRGPLEHVITPDNMMMDDGWGPIDPRLKKGLDVAARIALDCLKVIDNE